jgi:hypothetical protein
MSSIPEAEIEGSLDLSRGPAPTEDRAWQIAAAFVVTVLLLGALLALYVLAWDGGAHT